MSGDSPDARREPMSAERWLRLAPHLDAILELPAGERTAYCERLMASDAALGAELLRLAREADATSTLLSDGAVERFSLLLDAAPGETSATELHASLQASLGTTYRITHEIGGGGMSRVFAADDPALGRQVVIKVLNPDLSAGINADRFAREIRLAASLQQANIVPLLSAGTAAGFPYYTMPLVDGRSLRDRLTQGGALPIGDAISILRDVARALAFAHARGVVHRDIKPGNVLLSGGTAVVTDFGIAKALAAAAGADDMPADGMPPLHDITLTQTGSSLGTPAYMAPEQASGDPGADHRADLYSFGCMAYEMFAGAPPFHGVSIHHVIAAHFRDTPRPLLERRADVPPAVAALVTQCLEKSPSLRPQSAVEVLSALDTQVPVSAPVSPNARPRRRSIGVAAGVMAAIAVIAWAATRSSSAAEPLTIAAIPFTNKTGDTTLDYRSDGISDEILTGLARVPGVEIIGRSAAYRFKSRGRDDAVDIAGATRALGVRLLLTGTLREDGGRVTVFAELNDSTVRNELWSATFERDSRDLGSITDTVVRTLADTLHSLFRDHVGVLSRGQHATGTTNGEALSAYLEGQKQLKRRGDGVAASVESFEHAIALDPNFARAHAALANALQLYPHFLGTPAAKVRDRSMAAARQALQLDSTLADAHAALGSVHAFDARWQEAEAEFQRALALEPDNVAVRQTYARFLVLQSRPSEAVAILDQVRSLEPGSPLNSAWRSYAYYMLGRVDSALAENARAIRVDSTSLASTNFGALLNLAQGRPDVARHLVSVPHPVGEMTEAPYIFARLGDTASANALLRAMESNDPRPWFTDVARATVRIALGDSAEGLTLLERSARTSGAEWITYLPLRDPAFDLVRQSSRFARLLRDANLNVAAMTKPLPAARP